MVSAPKDKVAEVTVFLKRLLEETPCLARLRPKSPTARWAESLWDLDCPTDVAPSMKALGIDSQLTGSRADLIILDDIETPENSSSAPNRAKLVGRVTTESESILKSESGRCDAYEDLKIPKRVVVLGTPQTRDSIYNTMAVEHGYASFVWPARYPANPTQQQIGPADCRRLRAGHRAGNTNRPAEI